MVGVCHTCRGHRVITHDIHRPCMCVRVFASEHARYFSHSHALCQVEHANSTRNNRLSVNQNVGGGFVGCLQSFHVNVAGHQSNQDPVELVPFWDFPLCSCKLFCPS